MQNPPDIGLDAARHVVKAALGGKPDVAAITQHLIGLGWRWECVTDSKGLYLGIIGLPEEGDEPGCGVIAWTESRSYDVYPALLRATAMAPESTWARL